MDVSESLMTNVKTHRDFSFLEQMWTTLFENKKLLKRPILGPSRIRGQR